MKGISFCGNYFRRFMISRGDNQQQSSAGFSYQGGFSIIELSIILTVFSFFVINSFLIKDSTEAFSKVLRTQEKLEVVSDALGRYVRANGRYPCPADPDIAISNTEIGTENANTTGSDVFGIAACFQENAPALALPTLFSARTNDGAPTGSFVFLDIATYSFTGTVPIRALGLPLEYMIDDFGNRITYVIRQDLTNRFLYGLSAPGEAPFNSYDFNFDPTDGYVGTTIRVTNETPTPYTNNAAWVLISHGANGYGAWPFDGAISGGLTKRIAPPDISTTGGTFSAGELLNHHLDREASGLSVSNIIDPAYYVPLQPDTSTAAAATIASLVAYDDILSWEIQEQNIPYRNFNDTMITPHEIAGLAFWLDAQECRTMKTSVTYFNDIVVNDVCTNFAAGTGVDIKEWHEPITFYNNYMKDNPLPWYGSFVWSETPITPTYDPNPAPEYTINGKPVVRFDTTEGDVMLLATTQLINLANPSLCANATGPTDYYCPPLNDDQLRMEALPAGDNDMTIIVVGRVTPANASVYGGAFVSRSDLALLSSLAPANGYLFGNVGTVTPFEPFRGDRIGMAAATFRDGPPTFASPNQNNTVSDTAPDTNPHIWIASFDENTPNAEMKLYEECNLISTNSSVPQSSIDHQREEDAATVLPGPFSTLLLGRVSVFGTDPSLLPVGITPPTMGSLDGSIGEILIINRLLADWERAALTNYLAEKWGFSGINCSGATQLTSTSSPAIDAVAPNAGFKVAGGCSGLSLLGVAEANGAQCCSGNVNAATPSTCCMAPNQVHIERCTTNSDCCSSATFPSACSLWGTCYNTTRDPTPQY